MILLDAELFSGPPKLLNDVKFYAKHHVGNKYGSSYSCITCYFMFLSLRFPCRILDHVNIVLLQ